MGNLYKTVIIVWLKLQFGNKSAISAATPQSNLHFSLFRSRKTGLIQLMKLKYVSIPVQEL